MAGKGTGKYYAPVYRAKKYPMKSRQARMIRHAAFIAVVVAAAAIIIAAVQISRNDNDSFVKVAASEQSLAGVNEYPRIVNGSSPLPADYAPENLMSLATLPGGEDILLRTDAAEAFLTMCAAMSEDGLGIIPVRGYVSFDEQSSALTDAANRLIAEGTDAQEAQELARKEVFAPGEDEAQLGTSIDVSTDPNSVANFSYTEQYLWICRNAHRYGFIIRYNDAAKAVTGVSVKPWHLRYVGVEAAGYIFSANCSLEQYVTAVKADNPGAKEAD